MKLPIDNVTANKISCANIGARIAVQGHCYFEPPAIERKKVYQTRANPGPEFSLDGKLNLPDDSALGPEHFRDVQYGVLLDNSGQNPLTLRLSDSLVGLFNGHYNFKGTLRAIPPNRCDTFGEFVLNVEEICDEEQNFSALKLAKLPRKFGRQKLLRVLAASLIPQFGYYPARMAALYMLAGGVDVSKYAGSQHHGHINILLLGDEGTGRALQSLASHHDGSYVHLGTGGQLGMYRVGPELKYLSGAAFGTKLLCIDGLNNATEKNIGELEQILKQSAISYAKAGILGEFRTNCSVLAVSQTAVASGLEDCFDLVFYARPKEQIEHTKPCNSNEYQQHTNHYGWTGFLHAYLREAKKCSPVLSNAAINLLQEFFLEARAQDDYPPSLPTLRTLITLSEAQAKLRLGKRITLNDAFAAIELYTKAKNGRVYADIYKSVQEKYGLKSQFKEFQSSPENLPKIIEPETASEPPVRVVAEAPVKPKAHNISLDEFIEMKTEDIKAWYDRKLEPWKKVLDALNSS